MVPKLIIEEFIRAQKEIKEPITKFGGQPVWLTEPQWPISAGWDNRVMMFVCQIALDEKIFKNGKGKMAYLFITHPEDYNDDFFDPDIIFHDQGENAIIIQPEGQLLVNTKKVERGPTLFDRNGNPYEASVKLLHANDPDFIDANTYKGLPEHKKNEYVDMVDGNKIGGAPNFFQGDEWPEGEEWLLLMQLNSNFLPFVLNLGASPTGFAFISKDLGTGKFLVQDM